jgi:hypothetical protein
MKAKFFISCLFSLIFSATIGTVLGAITGVPGLLIGGASFASSFHQSKGALKIGLQKEVWIQGLKDEYLEKTTWLDQAEDLSSFVDEAQVLHFAETGAMPDVYKNKTDDVDSVEPTETPLAQELDTFDSQNYKIRQATLPALPYDKIQHYTRKSADAIRLKEALTAAWEFTPTEATAKSIVLPTTGLTDGAGKKLCTLNDIQSLAEACDTAMFPDGRNLVMTPKMWWQLVKNNDILKAQMQFQQKVGIIDPQVVEYYGIKIFRYTHKVGFNLTTSKKAAFGTAFGETVTDLSFLFCSQEVFRASGTFMMSYLPFSQNPKGRAHEFGFQHRFKAGFQRTAEKYSGILYSCPLEVEGGA